MGEVGEGDSIVEEREPVPTATERDEVADDAAADDGDGDADADDDGDDGDERSNSGACRPTALRLFEGSSEEKGDAGACLTGDDRGDFDADDEDDDDDEENGDSMTDDNDDNDAVDEDEDEPGACSTGGLMAKLSTTTRITISHVSSDRM